MNTSLAKNSHITNLNISYKKLKSNIKSLSDNLPKISYIKAKNVLFIKGNSTGKGIDALYESVINTIQNHFENADKFNLYLYIDSLNITTLKNLFVIFKILKNHKSDGKNVKITWFFDLKNNNMMDSAFDFSDLFDLPVTVVAV